MAKHYYTSLEDLGNRVAGYLDGARRWQRWHMGIMLVHGAVVAAHGAFVLASLL